MIIPEGFQYSASSLQDFEDCRYRFWLRYIKNADWPAVQSEPAMENERRLLLGARFHQLAQAYFSGLPADLITIPSQEAELAGWWGNFLASLPAILHPEPSQCFIEIRLSAQMLTHRLLAKMDLLCRFPDENWKIYDWKTGPFRPPSTWLKGRLQTRLYPYLLVRAGSALNSGQAVLPEMVNMTYWYPAFPDQPETFQYSQLQYEKDGAFLAGLLASIESMDDSDFTKTDRLETCRLCVYRSLCDRGTTAGEATSSPSELEEGQELIIDFDQIGEIAF